MKDDAAVSVADLSVALHVSRSTSCCSSSVDNAHHFLLSTISVLASITSFNLNLTEVRDQLWQGLKNSHISERLFGKLWV